MKLGLIIRPEREGFETAARLGLDFVEFCVNGNEDEKPFFNKLRDLRHMSLDYGVAVGSIGRWKAEMVGDDGQICINELEMAKRLLDTAAYLACPNYICGCNYTQALSFEENCERAISLFEKIISMKPKGTEISAYNCSKGNFVNTPKAWGAVLGRLPELGIKFDPSHPYDEGRDYLQEAVDWGDRIRHVHIKGSLHVNGRHIDDPPAGLDDIRWPSLIAILAAKGYDGGLSIEPHSENWKGGMYERGLQITAGFLRRLTP